MFKVSHAAIIAFLAVCTALMFTLVLAQGSDGAYTYGEQDDEEAEEWSW